MGACLITKGNPHDFGTYYEVACGFEYDPNPDVDQSESMVYAFKLENNTPAKWDGEARKEIAEAIKLFLEVLRFVKSV